MLLSSKGVVQMEGNTIELATELTSLLKGLMNKEVLTKKEIMNCLELALMSEEEVHKALISEMEKFMKNFNKNTDSDIFNEMFKDLFEDEK